MLGPDHPRFHSPNLTIGFDASHSYGSEPNPSRVSYRIVTAVVSSIGWPLKPEKGRTLADRFPTENLLPSMQMFPEPEPPVESHRDRILGGAVERVIARRYGESGAQLYEVTPERFYRIVAGVVNRYAAESGEREQVELVVSLRMEELVLARACSAGSDAAWEVFIPRFRAALYATACRLTRDETAGRELVDELNADLYGIPNSDGRRISKLDYYMGRGSLEGWLRTVLVRRYIDHCRSRSSDISLDEQIEHGVSFAQGPQTDAPVSDERVGIAIAHTLAELNHEERFLLVSYFLDRRTLADIGRQTGVHESTISRKLDRLMGTLRKRVRRRLQSAGVHPQRCDELLREIDVRDVDVNVAENLKQERTAGTF
jgi:RNA polymerase sigma factor (sigma-70 family)